MTKYHLRRRIYEALEVSDKKGTLSWYVDLFIMALILANVAAIVLSSVSAIMLEHMMFFYWFEFISVMIFTVEYILRVLTINYKYKYRRPVLGNLRFMLSTMGLIDFLAILPFYLPFLGVDFRAVRLLRIFRLFRLFKFARYIKALVLIEKVIKEKRAALSISLMLTFILLLLTSTLMYYIENPVQPHVFSSIPSTMWWGIATLTTVGYGDMVPISPLGKFLGGIIAVIGVGLFALPAGILASGFSKHLGKELSDIENKEGYCPCCGQELPDEIHP